jgi:type II secretory pathway component PulF
MSSTSAGRPVLTAVDLVGLGFAVLGLLWATVAVLLVAPSFATMFADLGGQLPTFTRLCLSRWFPFLIGSVPLAVAMVGPVLRAERPTRLLLMGLSIVLSLAMPAIFLVGMYLPIFSIAGSIK